MIAIFAGAGASKAVNTNSFPTTVDFFNKLPDNFKNEIIFKETIKYIHESQESEIIDIEKILWIWNEILDFLTNATDIKTSVGWFLYNNLVRTITNNPKQDTSFLTKNNGKEALLYIEKQINKINTLVYDHYSIQPTHNELNRNWIPLIRRVHQIDNHIEVFTTNYDLVIESTQFNMKNEKTYVDLCRSDGLLPELTINSWKDRLNNKEKIANNSYGLLTKLHGSVDWSWSRKNVISVGNPDFKGEHEKHVILYPGFKGVAQKPPFDLFHRYFGEILQYINAIVFIGFAFRDDYINTLIENNINPDAKVIIINPNDKIESPVNKSNSFFIPRGFDKASIDQCIEYIKTTQPSAAANAESSGTK